MRAMIISLAAAAAIAMPAAAATPIYWTPAHMVKAIVALQYPQAGVFSGRCVGTSKARRGAYSSFRCSMTWPTGTGVVWAKPMAAGRVCASSSKAAPCRPLARGPLAGDPTVCDAHDPAACAGAAAKAAVVKAHGTQVNLMCSQQESVYVWSCTAYSGSFRVTFTKGATQWMTTVTP